MVITNFTGVSAAHGRVEIVERKGIGHPDTIADALAENLSRNLMRFYVDRFGSPMHHNVDKALLCGGASRPRFGGGEVTEPIEILLAGRATRSYKGIAVPLEELAIDGSREWLRRHLRFLDPVRHVRIRCLIRPTSRDLVDLFDRGMKTGTILANDTSIGVGYFPLSPLERTVLHAESVLNDASVKAAYPALGEDIKVMGIREQDRVNLTVACAMVDAHVRDERQYHDNKAQAAQLAARVAAEEIGGPVSVTVNAADGDTADSLYLTVTGTSAEAGDDGQVGRGNRGNGLIAPYRPMTLEAISGKNPVSHTGKIYDLAARRIAQQVATQVDGVEEAYCYLVSRIGHSIAEPAAAEVQVRMAVGGRLEDVSPEITRIVQSELAGLTSLWLAAVA